MPTVSNTGAATKKGVAVRRKPGEANGASPHWGLCNGQWHCASSTATAPFTAPLALWCTWNVSIAVTPQLVSLGNLPARYSSRFAFIFRVELRLDITACSSSCLSGDKSA